MMTRFFSFALLCLVGCARGALRPDSAAFARSEGAKCELVSTLMREPLPTHLLEELGASAETVVPVLVFVRHPEQGLLERYFVGEPSCTEARFRVVAHSEKPAIVLYLQPNGEGYAFDAARAGPGELALEGTPRGRVVRMGGSWAAASD